MRRDGNFFVVWRGESGETLELVASTDSVTQTASGFVAFSVAPGMRFGVDDVSVVAADPETATFEYNAGNELTKTSSGGADMFFSYDDYGRRISKWDASHYTKYDYRLGKPCLNWSTFPGEPALVQYTYRADGRLFEERYGFMFNHVARRFQWAGHKLVGELDDYGTMVNSYAHNPDWLMGSLLADAPGTDPDTSAYRFMLADAHGSVRTALDDSRAALASREYGPYGEALWLNGAALSSGYTGMIQGTWGTELRFALRHYDAETMRWLTRDPLGMAGGVNMHAYAGGNPSSMVDPEGGSLASIFGGHRGDFGDWAIEYSAKCIGGWAMGVAIAAYGGDKLGAMLSILFSRRGAYLVKGIGAAREFQPVPLAGLSGAKWAGAVGGGILDFVNDSFEPFKAGFAANYDYWVGTTSGTAPCN